MAGGEHSSAKLGAEAERAIVGRIQAGDEAALGELVDAYHRPLLRIAEAYVGRGATAEDILQETWVAVVDNLGGFEGRSALKTWIVRILVNKAKTRRARDKRFVPQGDDDVEVLDGRFSGLGFWKGMPAYATGPEEALLGKEASGWLVAALEALPETQRAVVTLRDVEEWTSEEVCNALGLSDSNQRVILHRGRQRLRAVLEERVRETRAEGSR
ncbi:MAG: RNA polymerase sigma factor [Polyangiales bacterium]